MSTSPRTEAVSYGKRVITVLIVTLVCGRWAAAEEPTVRIGTSMGNIIVAVDIIHAPISAANFLRYVDHRL